MDSNVGNSIREPRVVARMRLSLRTPPSPLGFRHANFHGDPIRRRAVMRTGSRSPLAFE